MISTEQQRAAEKWGQRQVWLKEPVYGIPREKIMFDDGLDELKSVCLHWVDGKPATEAEARKRWEEWCK